MWANKIVIHHINSHIVHRLPQGYIVALLHPFIFKAAKPTLHWGIIPTVTLATHTLGYLNEGWEEYLHFEFEKMENLCGKLVNFRTLCNCYIIPQKFAKFLLNLTAFLHFGIEFLFLILISVQSFN